MWINNQKLGLLIAERRITIKRVCKIPAMKGWMNPDYKPPLTDFKNCGIAIKTGVSGKYQVIAIDIDTKDENLANETREMIFKIAGPGQLFNLGTLFALQTER